LKSDIGDTLIDVTPFNPIGQLADPGAVDAQGSATAARTVRRPHPSERFASV
jgi:hypothetical protein